MGRRVRLLTVGHGRGIPGAIYGTVVVMSTVAAGATSSSASALAGLVASTALVFYVAHVYAHAIGESIRSGHRISAASLAFVARREVSIVLAAVLPITALLLGAAGVVAKGTGVWLALVLGTLSLAVQGAAYARIERLGALRAVLVIGVNLALGLTIVALKVGLSH